MGDGLAFLVLSAWGSPDPHVKVTYEERNGDPVKPFEAIVLMGGSE